MPIAPLLLLLAVAVAGAAVVVAAMLRHGRPGEPVCGRCGYAVHGLETFQCPECGSDLRRVGIMTPRMRRAAGPVARSIGAAILWTVAVPIIGGGITAGLVASGVVSGTYSMQHTITFSFPASGAYATLQINAEGPGRGSTAVMEQASVQILDDAGALLGELDVNLVDGTYRHRNGLRWIDAEGSLTHEVIVAWLRDVTGSADERLADEAADIARQLSKLAGGATNASTTAYSSANTSARSIYTTHPLQSFASEFWFTIWLIGVIIIIRRGIQRTRAEREAEAAVSAS